MKREWLFNTLLIIFVTSIVIANVVGARVVTTGLSLCGCELATSGGALTYAFTFLCTDVIGEIWGKRKAMEVVKYGFVGQVFAFGMVVATRWLTATDPSMDRAYDVLLGQNGWFVLASLSAYYVAQTWDVWIFHRLRDWYCSRCLPYGEEYRGQGRWIWNNLSTMTSQIWDTVIYCGIAFGIGQGWFWKPESAAPLAGICLGQYALKFALAAVDTPVFYLLTMRSGHTHGRKE